MEQEEIIYKLQMSEQESNQLQEQMQAISQGILELSELHDNLDSIQGKKDKDIYALIGRNIFIPAKATSDTLLVDIGNKKLIEKSIPETKQMLKQQIQRLSEVQQEIENRISQLNSELEKTFSEFQKLQNNK